MAEFDSAEPSVSDASRLLRLVMLLQTLLLLVVVVVVSTPVEDWGCERLQCGRRDDGAVRCFSRAMGGVQVCECAAVTAACQQQQRWKRENEDERSAVAEEATARCSVTRKIRTKQRVVSECLGLFWFFL